MSEAAFLAQLEAQPDDDVLRLVYADWLDERDDPRGEFLRTAVLLRSDPANAALRMRLLELRPVVPTRWLLRVLHELATDDVREAVFRHVGGKGLSRFRDKFLSVAGADPSWYLLDRLQSDYPDLWPTSKDHEGEDATRYSFSGVWWAGRERCSVGFGALVMPLAGRGMRYGVELRGERWTITSEFQTWIS